MMERTVSLLLASWSFLSLSAPCCLKPLLPLEVRINDDSGGVMDSVKLIASDMDGTLLK